ncbi:T9SS C-terminal target domain-containing protein [Aggregatimonas sangjinii]|uniref:T9SS C-terminal target domain-containing protein n=1 Tax=Aggregatimonas sangjinii TaxID=2583587 RepID=A0A5B7SM91_9FLAO|nr:T9SS C-terminal target domain-containing protein [Aggregatimonas sangjinii]QCW99735.1 T9SS C-terminal target domain-containing protein [Aggregatimonas sangjinii]
MKALLITYLLCVTFLLNAQTEVVQLGELPEEVYETSGLIVYNENLITHNDSGNAAELYEIDTLSLSVTRTVLISNAENVDWEDIDQDEDYIYIADFGNTLGTRQNLKIYRVAKTAYDASDAVTAEEIGFVYEDQTDFTDNGFSDWDAEALFVLDEQLIILTKQWQSNNTVAYSLAKTPGNHIAQRLDEYAINGLVTGATYNTQSQVLYIIGYNSLLRAFINRVENPTTTTIFSGSKGRLNTDIGFAQIEGITYTGANSYFISSERFSDAERGITLPSLLFSVTTNDTIPNEPEPEPEPDGDDPFVLFRQFDSHELRYHLNPDRPVLGWAIFDSSGRRVLFEDKNITEIAPIDISALHPAIYYFNLSLAGETIALPFAVD